MLICRCFISEFKEIYDIVITFSLTTLLRRTRPRMTMRTPFMRRLPPSWQTIGRGRMLTNKPYTTGWTKRFDQQINYWLMPVKYYDIYLEIKYINLTRFSNITKYIIISRSDTYIAPLVVYLLLRYAEMHHTCLV